jgi:peptidoglycan hydrolase-like protein with peptidoglycan-binding domain
MSLRTLSLALLFAVALPASALTMVGGEEPSRDLTVGSRGSDVTWLQDYLIAQNAGSAAVSLKAAGATGYFGSLTRAALAEYQAAKGITPAAGYFGPKTRAHLSGGVTVADTATFSGKIEKVDTACFADGVCSVTIDGKEVVLLAGLRVPPIPPVGRLKGVDSIGDLEGKIGATAQVFAAKNTQGDADYTLYGNTGYYVEVLAKVPANGKVTVRGTTGCLPPKDTVNPVTALCALGLEAEDGNYYSLDYSAYSPMAGTDQEGEVEVTGTFTKGEHATWKSIGTIKVTNITKVK